MMFANGKFRRVCKIYKQRQAGNMLYVICVFGFRAVASPIALMKENKLLGLKKIPTVMKLIFPFKYIRFSNTYSIYDIIR